MANAAVNLDPRVGTDEASQKAHQLLYSTLLRIDDQLKPVPDLAESIETARRAHLHRPPAPRACSSTTAAS